MNTSPETVTDILPPNPIRVETALSRYPVHRLAKHGDIAIDIKEKNEHGEFSIKWEVNYPKKPGQPGPLAYKIDTLIVNRRIEEANRPIPKIIRLGSLREITEELGTSTHATKAIKKALHQNASAYITPKIVYRQSDGYEETLETGFNRYSVIFTGQKLPNGRKADAVYLVLNDIYMRVISGAMTRPLDYDYLKSLPPASQRFYELMSFKMYAAIRNDRHRAKLLYSELCTYAPLTRQHDWNVVRPQLARIHAPHKKSGYIAKIEFQDTVDSAGNPDWEMFYQPGPKARAEYRAFAKRGGPVTLEVEPIPAYDPPALAALQPPALPLAEPEPPPLVAELVNRGVTKARAEELVQQHPAEVIEAKLEVFDWLAKRKDKRIDKSPAGYLVKSITQDYATPKGFVSRGELEQRKEKEQAAKQAEAEQRRQKQEQKARDDAERQAINAYWDSLTLEQKAELEDAALAHAGESARQTYETMKRMRGGDGYLTLVRRQYIQHILHNQNEEA